MRLFTTGRASTGGSRSARRSGCRSDLREKPAGTVRITATDYAVDTVAKDMIAVPIGPDLSMAVVGAPSYFEKRSEPEKPQDLIGHNCINLRLPPPRGRR